jgi:hypothetical protein
LTRGHVILRMLIGSLSALGAVFLAPKVAFSTRAIEISGRGREAVRTVGLSRGILPKLDIFWRRQYTSRSYLSCSSTIGGLFRHIGSVKGGLQYEPVDLCHLPILKTSSVCVVDASLLLQNQHYVFLTTLQNSFLVLNPVQYS